MSMEQLGETFDLHAGGEDLIFPHHENEIAQSESLTGKTFANFWFHARFLLVEGEKMSKSMGNFFTPRDLVLKGHKPSSIRYLLASVPYRNQLNFTWDGLRQAATSVERLRNFRLRLSSSQFAAGANDAMTKLAEETMAKMKAALEDDLNTAQAQAAIFEMVRAANAALDAGEIRNDDVSALLAVMTRFDEIFAVVADDDAAKVKAIIEWARSDGREKDITPEALAVAGSGQLSDAEIETKVAEMETARKARNFKVSDALRAELVAAGILIEMTKDGIRWRRK
jgi:cysteinyl-tRNA synthetase